MIKILVTGGKGQLASCIKDLEKSYDNLKLIYTDCQELDITDLEAVEAFFKKTHIDYCINCAAYTAVDQAEIEQKLASEVNELGAKNLATICNDFRATLIHISTDFVFDGKKTEPYTELDFVNPISVYGETKLEGEQQIIKILAKYYIIRTSWLYSEHGNNFMKTMMRLAQTRNEISVVSDQIGTPTYARDLAQVLLILILKNNKEYGVYHYSNEGVASWYDFANAIFQISGVNMKITGIPAQQYPTLAKRPAYSVMDKSKIKCEFGISPLYWKDSLLNCLKNYHSLI
jgi:dTDP-4-dehydrorhamnose reductase